MAKETVQEVSPTFFVALSALIGAVKRGMGKAPYTAFQYIQIFAELGDALPSLVVRYGGVAQNWDAVRSAVAGLAAEMSPGAATLISRHHFEQMLATALLAHLESNVKAPPVGCEAAAG